MAIYLRPYKTTSKSARELRDVLGVPFLKERGRRVNQHMTDTIINWGGTTAIDDANARVYNQPRHVAGVVSKLQFLERLDDYQYDLPDFMQVLPFRKDIDEAVDLFDNFDRVYCRQLIKSCKGRGIVVARTPDELVEAPLYTAGVSCKREYRVHIFKQRLIDITAKVRVTDESNPVFQREANGDIKNLGSGFVFARNSVKIPNRVRDNLCSVATNLLSIFNLNFGAIDVIRTEDDLYYPLELNTAPGITGTTLAKYVEAFATINL